jgi:hypothetical protein
MEYDYKNYTEIGDNTEGIEAVKDLDWNSVKNTEIILDIGSGSDISVQEWLYKNTGCRKVLRLDPYKLTEKENLNTKEELKKELANVVLSMSVLNVIENKDERREHLQQLKSYCKEGGIIYIKIWNGISRDMYGKIIVKQEFSDYLTEIKTIFNQVEFNTIPNCIKIKL